MPRDDALKIRSRGSRVVSVKEWDDGRWKRDDLDRNERYTLKDGLLVHERSKRVRYYADENSDASADPVISGGTNNARMAYDNDAYRFDLMNGQVTNLQEFDDGRWKRERIDSNETWSFDGTNLIKTERERYGSEISTFSDPDGDGLFTKISEIYAASV